MYCPKCGEQNDDNNFKCVKCGAVIQNIPVTPVAVKKKNTLTVVLVVAGIAFGLIIVIGILAAIAIPTFIGYKAKAHNAMAQGELRNACATAAEILSEHPGKIITLDDLKGKGVGQYPEVELSIMDGSKDNLAIGARHSKGGKVYAADKNCDIKEIQH